MATSTGSVTYSWQPPQKKSRQSRKTDTFLDPTLDTGLPSSRNDIAVPYLIGRRLVENPNTIWNSPPRTKITTVETTPDKVQLGLSSGSLINTGGSSAGATKTSTGSINLSALTPNQTTPVVTIESVESRFDFAFGLCLGPDVRLLSVLDEKRNIIHKAPTDQETESPNSPWVIDQWNDKEDVVNEKAKSLKFYSGSWDQPKDPTIVKREGDNRTPAFRGTAYAVFADAVISEDDTEALPYAFEIYRTPDPLGLAGDNRNSEFDVNIATALYDIITSAWGMVGAPVSLIDIPTFVDCGHVLADEGNYCTVWMTQTAQAKAIIGVLSDQAYGAIRWNSFAKKLQFVLFRNDYVIDDLPLFNIDNLEDVTSLQKDHWIVLPKAIQVDFANRAKNYETTPAIVGLSKGSADTSRKVEKITFETVTQVPVALAIATREYSRSAAPLLSADLQANRDGATVVPGDVIALDWPELHPTKFPFRVIKTKEKGSLLDTTTLTVEQAISPIVSTAYGPLRDLAQKTNERVDNPGEVATFALPLFLARYKPLNFVPPVDAFTDNAMYPFIVAKDGPESFIVEDAMSENAIVALGFAPTTAKLKADITRMDGYSDGKLITLDVTPGEVWDNFIEEPNEKQSWFKINNELFRYDFGAITDDTCTLFNVQRGLVDTVAEDHAAGTDVMFLGGMDNGSSYGYDVDEGSVFLSVYGYNGKDQSAEATPLVLEMEQRANLPACPQNAMVSLNPADNTYPRTDGPQNIESWWDTYYISWRRRDYLSTSFQGRSDGANPVDTTYDVYLRVGATVAILGTDIAGTELETEVPVGFPAGLGQIEIAAKNANGESLFREFIAVNVNTTP